MSDFLRLNRFDATRGCEIYGVTIAFKQLLVVTSVRQLLINVNQ